MEESMEEKKVCLLCENHENPYLDEMPAVNAIDQNFITLKIAGSAYEHDIHGECWWMENR